MNSLILSTVIIFISVFARAQMDLPAEGDNIRATISEEVGITSITIKYSAPGVKGREGKIWGTVVANGFNNTNFITSKNTSPWRAGANEATVISFEHDVKVEGKDLKAGSYALFMAMGTDSVTLIFSKQTEAWGSFYYRKDDDVLLVNVKPVALDKSNEWLKYEFIDHKEKSCVIALQWEKLSVPFKVEVDVYNIVIARLREQVISSKGFLGPNLLHGSRYCFIRNINLEEALTWAQRAVSGRPFPPMQYMALTNLAMGYEKLNRIPQADSVMNEALPLAIASQYTTYARTLITQKRQDRAMAIMLAALTKFGDVYAVNSGLSYAYSAKADYGKALEYANRAQSQATTPQIKMIIAINIEKLKAKKDINQ
jgi:hypothetical protein